MADNSKARRNLIIAVLIILLLLLLLFLYRCNKPPAPSPTPTSPSPTPAAAAPSTPSTPPPATPEPTESLTPATITAPPQVPAGAAFSLTWTGPNNPSDYITIVRIDAPADAYGSNRETRHGPSLELTAPIDPGPHELRYITSKSRTILGRAAIEVTPVTATLDAPAEVTAGSEFTVTWTGPDNKGDYITIVDPAAGPADYRSYAETEKGPTLKLTAATTPGDYEIRYISGPSNSRTILARRPIRVLAASVGINAPASAVAGSKIRVSWAGPNNRGDFITIVEKTAANTAYGQYFDCSKPPPQELLTPLIDGAAEIRYVTKDYKVLDRRPITLSMPKVTLSAPEESSFDTNISIKWTGPDYAGDYITIVPKETPDGQYGPYTLTNSGSPLSVKLPKALGGQPGATSAEYEVRYMTGQGNKVLARTPIRIK